MTTKLRDMPWAEAEPIYRAFHEGRELTYTHSNTTWWSRRTVLSHIASDGTYRLPPTTPDTVDWNQLPEWAMWVARDGDGTVRAYEFSPGKPEFSLMWVRLEGRFVRIDQFPFYTPGTCDWTESLQQRPEGEG